MISLSLLLGVLIDWLAGEPKRWHPLVGFGLLAQRIERLLNPYERYLVGAHSADKSLVALISGYSAVRLKLSGLLAVILLCLPLPLMLFYVMPAQAELFELSTLFNALLVYFAIGHRSLWDHINPIVYALQRQDEVNARYHTAMIVSRDAETLDIEVSAVESVLENGSDAVFGAIFWFVVAGAPGIIFYRLVNTLDAMWGYRTERYCHFGWAAAKLDDGLNYLPARCTALSYAVLSDATNALRCWKTQAAAHASPNGGPVIAAGAGGLGVLLGGPTRYQGVWQDKPYLGTGSLPKVDDLQRAMRLVSLSLLLWLCLIGSTEYLGFFFMQSGDGL